MQSIALRLGVIGAIVVGGILLRPYLTGSASDLAVGHCFDEPTDASDTVDDVQNRPCTDPHDAEVVFVGDFTPDSGTYPTDEQFLAFFETSCTAAFNSYTGLDFATDPTYDMSAYTPTAAGWAEDSDRKVICFAIRLDGEQMTAPIKQP